ncbi:MAG TPA: hypothetical protein ENK06_00220 [Gammaproteobacteria bacterium]|nr:hypothetical protein [Gammaproteobacteria bacterium]
MVSILTHCRHNTLAKRNTFLVYSIVIFLSLFFSCFVHSEEVSFAEDIFQPGLSDFESGDYQSAAERLEMAIKNVSGCQEVVLTKAAAGDGLSAMEALLSQPDDNRCGSVNSENLWNAHFYLALTYLKLDNRPRALEEIEKAKSIDADKRPDSNIFSEDIVGLFDAAPETTVVLAQEPWRSELQQGISEYEAGEYEVAIRHFHNAIAQYSAPNCLLLADPLEAMQCETGGSNDLWKAHFYMAMSNFILGKERQALENFIASKRVDENSTPDPQMFSPNIVSLYNSDLNERLKCLDEYGNVNCIKPASTRLKNAADDGVSKPFWKSPWFWAGVAAVAGFANSKRSRGDDTSGDDTVVVSW